VLGACALLAAGTASGLGAPQLLRIRPLVLVGDLSYSWYLWHWPLIVFARALWPGWVHAASTAAVLSIVPAWLSYRYVENPLRRRVFHTRRAAVAFVAVCIGVPLVASGGLLEVQAALDKRPAMRSWMATQAEHLDQTRGCNLGRPLGAWTDAHCSWRVPHPKGSVILAGDSNAGHFSEPVVRAANEAGYDAEVVTAFGCPFARVRAEHSGRDAKACERFVEDTMRALVRRKPSLVVVASRMDVWVGNTSFRVAPAGTAGAASADERVKATYLRAGLTSILQELRAAGIPVVVVQGIPSLPTAGQGCAVLRVLEGSCADSVSRQAVDVARARSVALVDAAVAAAPGSHAIDFIRSFCDARSCSSTRGGTVLYRDIQHLTVGGALLLTSQFSRLIATDARPR
jgi:hypothetical protein